MFLKLFYALKSSGVPVTIREYLDMLKGLEKGICNKSKIDDFYNFARLCLVKDEKYFDRFDLAFKNFYEFNKDFFLELKKQIPKDWIGDQLKKFFSEEMKKKVKNDKDWEEVLKEFEKILKEQEKKHQGGNKWIGTGGTSMYGNSGYNPKGIRVGGTSKNRSAVKVWDKREFKNLDDQISLNIRNIQVALRRLRKFARQSSELEFDLKSTIFSTSKNGGVLDIKFCPERTNKVRVLLFIDIGGSMDEHAQVSEEIFSAAHSEFKSLDFFYFHNCIYENVWKDNRRRSTNLTSIEEILRIYKKDTKIIIIGDALMSPYEIVHPGGSIEHWNELPGSYWIKKITNYFEKVIWLNPEKKNNWDFSQSTKILKELSNNMMFELNISGIESGMKELAK
ncbi:MAG: hypothetical protein CFH34_00199 [Alphaproteobacteria bacterium MarineAlpha9_Bin4]|nr:hypothetical protein [Pelagibacterales bacterium]PPR27482.1 MAG: hypothetical protein CFH34_00199 [Alphaproteobacteria bacterium MarineAlpha9_Bin4]